MVYTLAKLIKAMLLSETLVCKLQISLLQTGICCYTKKRKALAWRAFYKLKYYAHPFINITLRFQLIIFLPEINMDRETCYCMLGIRWMMMNIISLKK